MIEEKKDPVNRTPDERRVFPRLDASVDVEYNILEKEGKRKRRSVSKNISVGGICLIVYEKIDVGDILALKIHLTDVDYIIEVEGRVVWSSHFTMNSDRRDRYDLGIEFVKISDSAQKILSQYVFRLIK
jgi:c-di-GMP-binding flagellar brake protein YcgR